MTMDEVVACYADALADEGRSADGKLCVPVPKEVAAVLDELPEGVSAQMRGGASPLPPMLEGCTVLDLGCGTGAGVFAAAKLVGPEGRVIGIDHALGRLETARACREMVAEALGYDNMEFLEGYAEDLAAAGIGDSSIDVVVANCMINHSPCKELILAEIWRVLKEGGELYFTTVFSDRRITEEQKADPLLSGTCLAGALYVEDFRRMMRAAGWEDFRYPASFKKRVDDPAKAAKFGDTAFFTRTVRAFKLPKQLEDLCEQYGQTATYLGTVPGMPDYFDLDDHHRFVKDEPLDVCGNSCAMVENTRYGAAFAITGDRSVHHGPFPGCGNVPYEIDEETRAASGACCC